ncbi:MAG: MOSC domain-containing protein [Myxococcota bacterium]
MELSALTVFPIKSLAGIPVDRAEVRLAGFRHDRRWMLVDGNDRFLTQRQLPQMALAKVAFEGAGYRIDNGSDALWIPETHDGPARQVTIWRSEVPAAEFEPGHAFFRSWLGRDDVRLVHLSERVHRSTNRGLESDQVSFADGYPYLLIGQSSLDDLNTKLDTPVPMGRFRPNLVVRGALPYAEDDWSTIQIGDLRFRNVKPCERCVMTTIDLKTATKGKEPLRTLATYRRRDGKVLFGVNLCPDGVGELQLGAAVRAQP